MTDGESGDSAKPLLGDESWQRVREAWPGIELPYDVFSEFVSPRLTARRGAEPEPQACADDVPSTAAPTRHTPRPRQDVLVDLYLTCACSLGDPRAILALEDRYAGLFESIRARFRTLGPTFDEVVADVRAHLFVARPSEPPRIVEYAGWVELGAWLKVVVTRLVLNRLAARRPEEAHEDSFLDGLLVTWQTPEQQLMHEQAKGHFRGALRRALSELRARHRQLLRFAFSEGLTIDDLAALYGVHRTTAFRWVKQASDDLASRLERIVREELNLSQAEYAAWCAGLRSQLELSIERYLQSTR